MSKKTSKYLASQAGQILNNPNSSQIQRELAGSVLSQYGNANITSDRMETKASNVLRSDKYSDETKQLAASVLVQAKE